MGATGSKVFAKMCQAEHSVAHFKDGAQHMHRSTDCESITRHDMPNTSSP